MTSNVLNWLAEINRIIKIFTVYKNTLQNVCTFMVNKEISIYVRACACPIVCRLKIDRCTHRGLNGARLVVDTSPSCNVFQVWHRSFFASGVPSNDFAWPPPWESWRLCTPSHSRSDYPWVSRSRKWGILCPIPCEEKNITKRTGNNTITICLLYTQWHNSVKN